MELVERKYSKYFKNLARKIKRNGYKRENMSKLKKGCSFSKPREADQIRRQKKAS